MEILNQPIQNLDFDSVVSFCEQKRIEGVQLDYKEKLPEKGLAKHFAAFANTRGGLIIIGVAEDHTTGLPVKWDGVKNEGKLVDKIASYALNVDATPVYDIHMTNEKKGKVFILVRIYEGQQTPYYVKNDTNVYIRTGNITKLVDVASPDLTELLYGRRKQAIDSRKTNLNKADEIFTNALARGEAERLRLLSEASKKEDGSYQSITKLHLGPPNAAMFSVVIQPYAPTKSLISRQDLKAIIPDIRADNAHFYYPSLNVETVPEGVMAFEWVRHSGAIDNHQVYTYGLIYRNEDVLRVHEGKRMVYLSLMAESFMNVLLVANKFYHKTGYQGGLVVNLHLKGIKNAAVQEIVPTGWNVFFPESSQSLLDEHSWEFSLDTLILSSPAERQAFFVNNFLDISYDLNMDNTTQDAMKGFLKDQRWLVE